MDTRILIPRLLTFEVKTGFPYLQAWQKFGSPTTTRINSVSPLAVWPITFACKSSSRLAGLVYLTLWIRVHWRYSDIYVTMTRMAVVVNTSFWTFWDLPPRYYMVPQLWTEIMRKTVVKIIRNIPGHNRVLSTCLNLKYHNEDPSCAPIHKRMTGWIAYL